MDKQTKNEQPGARRLPTYLGDGDEVVPGFHLLDSDGPALIHALRERQRVTSGVSLQAPYAKHLSERPLCNGYQVGDIFVFNETSLLLQQMTELE
jgi:hypothetical protein